MPLKSYPDVPDADSSPLSCHPQPPFPLPTLAVPEPSPATVMLLPPPFLHPRSCLAAELMLSFLLQCHMIFSPTSPLTWYITSPKFKNCVFQPCVFKVDQRFWAFDAQYSLSPSLALVLLPEKLGSPPGGHQAKRHTGEGRIYYLQQVRRTPGIFLKAASPQQQNWGGFKLRVYAYS